MLKDKDYPPFLGNEEKFYLGIYNDLSTTRGGGMGPSPISWEMILKYSTFYGLEFSIVELVIRGIDNLFLGYINGKKDHKN